MEHPVDKIMKLIVEQGYTDDDLISEYNKEARIVIHNVFRKYKTVHSRAKHITQELVDRNYIQSDEDEIGCREFIRGYFIGRQDR